MGLRRRRDELEESGLSLERAAAKDRESTANELIDVPAAIVCLLCGQADCPGCEDERSQSGVVAIIAWERPGLALTSRLWATARATTRDAETFFELMPDGPLLPALRFAATCEVLAISSMLLAVIPVLAVAAPEWLKHLVLDPTARQIALRASVFGIPAFAGLMVLGHAAHGLSVDLGATRNGGRAARSRALRFGLYACGWDLVIGPLGAIVVAFKEGVARALDVANVAGLPTRATRAFLRGCYRLEGPRADEAIGTSYVGAVVVTMFAVVVVIVGLVAIALA